MSYGSFISPVASSRALFDSFWIQLYYLWIDHVKENFFGKSWAPRPRAQSDQQIVSFLNETNKRFRCFPTNNHKKSKSSRPKLKNKRAQEKKAP